MAPPTAECGAGVCPNQRAASLGLGAEVSLDHAFRPGMVTHHAAAGHVVEAPHGLLHPASSVKPQQAAAATAQPASRAQQHATAGGYIRWQPPAGEAGAGNPAPAQNSAALAPHAAGSAAAEQQRYSAWVAHLQQLAQGFSGPSALDAAGTQSSSGAAAPQLRVQEELPAQLSLEDVNALRASLDACLRVGDLPQATFLLQLMMALPFTPELLAASQIGRYIRALQAGAYPEELTAAAGQLLLTWQQVVREALQRHLQQTTPQAVPQPGCPPTACEPAAAAAAAMHAAASYPAAAAGSVHAGADHGQAYASGSPRGSAGRTHPACAAPPTDPRACLVPGMQASGEPLPTVRAPRPAWPADSQPGAAFWDCSTPYSTMSHSMGMAGCVPAGQGELSGAASEQLRAAADAGCGHMDPGAPAGRHARSSTGASVRPHTGSATTHLHARHMGQFDAADVGPNSPFASQVAQASPYATSVEAGGMGGYRLPDQQAYWPGWPDCSQPDASLAGPMDSSYLTTRRSSGTKLNLAPLPAADSCGSPSSFSQQQQQGHGGSLVPTSSLTGSKRKMSRGASEDTAAPTPSGRTPVWTSDEVQVFLRVLKEHGRNYARLMEALPHRPKEQIRNFFNNHKVKLKLNELLISHGHSTQVVSSGEVHGRHSSRAAASAHAAADPYAAGSYPAAAPQSPKTPNPAGRKRHASTHTASHSQPHSHQHHSAAAAAAYAAEAPVQNTGQMAGYPAANVPEYAHMPHQFSGCVAPPPPGVDVPASHMMGAGWEGVQAHSGMMPPTPAAAHASPSLMPAHSLWRPSDDLGFAADVSGMGSMPSDASGLLGGVMDLSATAQGTAHGHWQQQQHLPQYTTSAHAAAGVQAQQQWAAPTSAAPAAAAAAGTQLLGKRRASEEAVRMPVHGVPDAPGTTTTSSFGLDEGQLLPASQLLMVAPSLGLSTSTGSVSDQLEAFAAASGRDTPALPSRTSAQHSRASGTTWDAPAASSDSLLHSNSMVHQGPGVPLPVGSAGDGSEQQPVFKRARFTGAEEQAGAAAAAMGAGQQHGSAAAGALAGDAHAAAAVHGRVPGRRGMGVFCRRAMRSASPPTLPGATLGPSASDPCDCGNCCMEVAVDGDGGVVAAPQPGALGDDCLMGPPEQGAAAAVAADDDCLMDGPAADAATGGDEDCLMTDAVPPTTSAGMLMMEAAAAAGMGEGLALGSSSPASDCVEAEMIQVLLIEGQEPQQLLQQQMEAAGFGAAMAHKGSFTAGVNSEEGHMAAAWKQTSSCSCDEECFLL